jgi:hypothetical protein
LPPAGFTLERGEVGAIFFDRRGAEALIPGIDFSFDVGGPFRWTSTCELVEVLTRHQFVCVLLPLADVLDFDDCDGCNPTAEGVVERLETPLVCELPLSPYKLLASINHHGHI